MVTFSSFIGLFRKYFFSINDYVISVRNLKEVLPEVNAKIPVFIVTEKLEQLNFEDSNFPYYTVALIKKRFKIDYVKTYFALDGESRILGVAWVAFYRDPNDGVRLIMQKNEALLLESFVIHSFRGNRVQSSLILSRLKDLKSQGFSAAYTICDVKNIISKRAIHNLGFRDIKLAKYFKIFGKGFQIQKDL